MNPFKYGRVVLKEDFCPRPELVADIVRNISANQNIYLEGERRVGKTSLIYEAAGAIKNTRLLYIDILEIKTIDDFCRRIINALLSMESKAGLIEKFIKYLGHLKPAITIDPLTTMPSVSLDPSMTLKPESIEGLLELIKAGADKKKKVVVFDEFQDILNLKESSSILAILRSKIQFYTDIPFIFAGSIRANMDKIFTDSESPFFKSAIFIYVGEIEKIAFKKFITDKFNIEKRKPEPALLDKIFDIAQNNPGDIQQACSAIWDVTKRNDLISENIIPAALELIFSREMKGYEELLNQVSAQQLRCLSALARAGGKAPFSNGFLKYSGISQPGSVKKTLTRLMQLRIVYKYNNEYRFINPYFKEWLKFKGI